MGWNCCFRRCMLEFTPNVIHTRCLLCTSTKHSSRRECCVLDGISLTHSPCCWSAYRDAEIYLRSLKCQREEGQNYVVFTVLADEEWTTATLQVRCFRMSFWFKIIAFPLPLYGHHRTYRAYCSSIISPIFQAFLRSPLSYLRPHLSAPLLPTNDWGESLMRS